MTVEQNKSSQFIIYIYIYIYKEDVVALYLEMLT